MIQFHSARIIATALVLLGLVCAQWTGVQHRVAHAGLTVDHIDQLASGSHDDDPLDLAHSCILFDAAALGATLFTAFALPVCVHTAFADAQLLVSSGWHAPLVKYFSPRAPPFF